MLKREIGLAGAVMMGLGSILGTGVFVSIGIGAGIAGPSVILAIFIAGLVASLNALNSAQLAASHPVSGGTYEYGYRYLNPAFGFLAGWMFVCAKSASASAAAIGLAGYFLAMVQWQDWLHPNFIAIPVIVALTGLVACGVRQSKNTNMAIVCTTIACLLAFVLAGLMRLSNSNGANLRPFLPDNGYSFLQATALMFVAYTGYGRIATLGEEVRDPQRTIPAAIIITLVISLLIYICVATVAISTIGSDQLSAAVTEYATPLSLVAEKLQVPGIAFLVSLGALTAMLAVLLNLILGLSRVFLAMGRRGDMPTLFATINQTSGTPTIAVIVVGLIVVAIAMIGDIKLAWSFSAFTVLIYYAITNLAALRLSAQERMFPRWIAVLGLLSCLMLAFFVEPRVWLFGLGIAGAGLAWHCVRRRFTNNRQDFAPNGE
jgi:basic amino acid/polyamine antiporter, APA family